MIINGNVYVNPGTEGVKTHSLKNALKSIKKFCADCGLEENAYTRDPSLDDDRGYYGFQVWDGIKRHPVEIPGCEPELLIKSKAWESPRMYVDGSSWLYGFAISAMEPDPDE